MTFIARTKLQAVSDGPFISQPRSATIITLSKPKQGPARWWLPFGVMTLFAGILAGASWNNSSLRLLPPVSISLSMPSMSDIVTLLRRDPEASTGYVETINPPPSDVVVPIPIVSQLPPSLEKLAGNSIDLSAGIALPASSLQVPDPEAADPTLAGDQAKVTTKDDVAAIAAAINDTPALADSAKPKIEVRNIDAPIIGHMIEEARISLEAGDNEGAMAIYNRILTHQHNNRAALAGQAFAAQRAGDYETAVKADHHLLALDQGNEDARINLVAALSAWDAAPALKELQHLVQAHPDFAPGHVALAQRLAGDGKVLLALPHMEHAVELEPENVTYKLDLAVTYDKLGHSGEAVELYREVLKVWEALDGRTPVLPVSRASIRQRVGYLEKLMASVDGLATQQ